MTEENDTADADVERFLTEAARAINEGDWEAYGNLFTEDLVMVTPSLPGISRGREARVSMVQGIMEASPTGIVEGVRSFGRGDLACAELRFSGTDPEGEIVFDLPYCMVMRFNDGKVAELNEYYDQSGM